MTQRDSLIELEEILEGIDQAEENENELGWWDNSIGADFGKGKLEELKALINKIGEAKK